MKALFFGSIAGGILRLLAATWRVEIRGDEHVRRLRSAGVPVVFAVWHAYLLAPLWHRRGEGITLLISEHTDGGYLASAVNRWGYRVMRGSSTRGAVRGLLGLVKTLRSGGDVALTPDGPRGPARVTKPGAVAAAARAGAAIVPVGVGASAWWQLASWDGFTIPRPLARVRIVYGQPLYGNLDSENPDVDSLLGKQLDATTELAAC